MLEALDQERADSPRENEELLYARKTYRYLRIAMVSMVATILISVIMQSIDAGDWLGSLSAYYFTPVHAVFIGALVTTGVCLVAIRGVTNPEDIALNLAGMSAPLVAFVPTAFPSNSDDHKNLFDAELPISAMQLNNVVALAITGGIAVILALFLGTSGNPDRLRAALPRDTLIGFGLAAALMGGYLLVFAIWGSQGVHNMSAGVLIGGLWFVATLNAVRRLRDEHGRRSWRHHLAVGGAGSALLFGATLTIAGIAHAIDGSDSSITLLIVGLVLIVVPLAAARSATMKFFAPPTNERGKLEWLYVGVAATMVTLGPLLGFWPGDFDHRTLWVEVVELLPFAVFWVVQTVEYWNPTVDEALAAN